MTQARSLPPLRETIREFGLDARKSLGQHFLLDLNLTRKIVRAARVSRDDVIYEVGPGPGGLSRALLETGASVIAIEADARCVAALAPLSDAFPDRLRVVHGDALDSDENALAGRDARVVANLPYGVSTALLVKWLTEAPMPFRDLTLMFQKEVADRILAPPRTKSYGRISVLAQWRCEVARAFDVPAAAFVPPPKVDSTVVRLTQRPAPIAVHAMAVERVTAAAFGQRRKMLRTSLKTCFNKPLAVLQSLAIDPTARAEELSVPQFCALADALKAN